MWKMIGRRQAVQRALGSAMAGWLKFVHRTQRWTLEPADLYGDMGRDLPAIVVMWHGQHFLVSFMRREGHDFRVLISRHGDAEINAVALTRLGVGLVRGSGGAGAKAVKRGAVPGALALLKALKEGASVTFTADVPKTEGVAGLGAVTLAKLSGRPIYPVGVATSRALDVPSWDRASVPLPFGRGAYVLGDAIRVPPDADDAALEAKRLELQTALDRVQTRAYAIAGRKPWRRPIG